MKVGWINFNDRLWSKHYRLLLALGAALLFILLSYQFLAHKEIVLAVDGVRQRVITRSDTVADLLAANSIHYSPHDFVKPDLDSVLEPGDTVTIKHAIPVVVDIDGKQQFLMPIASDIAALLKQLGIEPGADVRVSPIGYRRLRPGMVISVNNLDRRFETIESPVAFESRREDDASLLKGTTKITSKGEAGTRQQVVEHIFSRGVEIETHVKSDVVVKTAVAQVTKVGTKAPQLAAVPTRAPAPVFQGSVSRGDGRLLSMTATGYATGDAGGAGSRTATGTGVYKGIVAVDPRVIPLGTRLYIDGYGPGIAADTGGAIKGNRIDLAFGSVGEALAWGRRAVVVRILP